jgi:hypothetical protein
VFHDPETVRRLLERDLIEWAEDLSLRLVWADLLQIDGDPLGELVVLDHVAELAAETLAERARAEAEQLRRRLHPRLWDEEVPPNPGVELVWKLGFVREVKIRASKLSTKHTPPPSYWGGRRRAAKPTRLDTIAWLMPLLLRQPALRWVEAVYVEVPDHEAAAWSLWATDARGISPTLREIHIGDPPALRCRPPGLWEPGSFGSGRSPRTDGLIRSFRRLRWLSIGGEMVRLPCYEGSSDARLHHVRRLATQPLTSPNRASLARALWDASPAVHQAAFASARSLGARAVFLLEDLAWFLREPIGKKDPRPAEALRTLAAIGPASASLLTEVLDSPGPLTAVSARREALMLWLASLGEAARRARPLIDAVLAEKAGEIPKSLRTAAKRARKAVEATPR